MVEILYPLLAITNLVCMIIQFVINGLNADGDNALFHNSTSELSDYFYTVITPAGWTFSIWGVIYLWQTLWTIYAVMNLFLKVRTPSGGERPAFVDPEFLPSSVVALAIVGCVLNASWLLTFAQLKIEAALANLVGYSVTLYVALALSYIALDRASPELITQGRETVIWLVRALVHNGLAIMAAWVSVATLLNLAMVLTYSWDEPILSLDDAGTAALVVLTLEIFVFALTDLLFLDRWTRYTVTPYGVLVVALSGIISKNYTPGGQNSVFTIGLLVGSGILALMKLTLTVYRHARRPRYNEFVVNKGDAAKGSCLQLV